MPSGYKISHEEACERFKQKNLILLDKYINSSTKVLVKCYCNKEFKVIPISVFTGNTISCGCYNKEQISNHSVKNILNKRFGKFVVIEKTNIRKERKVVWKCLCDCGTIKYVIGKDLRTGHTQSCGCTNKNRLKTLTGDKNPAWNPNLSEKDRIRNEKYDRDENLRKQCFERDKYTCQVCGKVGGKLAAHHKDGYNWCKERRLDILNMITLCDGKQGCHKKFHKKYGRGNNTEQQFEEFKNNENNR